MHTYPEEVQAAAIEVYFQIKELFGADMDNICEEEEEEEEEEENGFLEVYAKEIKEHIEEWAKVTKELKEEKDINPKFIEQNFWEMGVFFVGYACGIKSVVDDLMCCPSCVAARETALRVYLRVVDAWWTWCVTHHEWTRGIFTRPHAPVDMGL